MNPFIESLSVPKDLFIAKHIVREDKNVDPLWPYHGSPFSPEQMSIVFEQQGYSDGAWAILPQKPTYFNAQGERVPKKDGPSVSAGNIFAALNSSFLNEKADHFVDMEDTAGFTLYYLVDGFGQTTGIIPRSIAKVLTEKNPTGYAYRLGAYGDLYKPVFDNAEEAARGRDDRCSKKAIRPLGYTAISFADYRDTALPLVATDCSIGQLAEIQNDISEQATMGKKLSLGNIGIVDLFHDKGIDAELF